MEFGGIRMAAFKERLIRDCMEDRPGEVYVEEITQENKA